MRRIDGRLALTLAILIAALAPAAARAQAEAGATPAAGASVLGPVSPRAQAWIDKSADWMTTKLGLTAEQRALFVASRLARAQWRADRRSHNQAGLPADREAWQVARRNFHASLTDAQKQQLAALRTELRTKAEARIDAAADRVTAKLNLTPEQRQLFVNLRSAAIAARFPEPGTGADVRTAAHQATRDARLTFLSSLTGAQRQEFRTLRARWRPATPAPTTIQ